MPDYGLEQLYPEDESPGDQAEVDLVFVHGLRGHYLNTWKKDTVIWPSELLPTDIPNCRIFSFGYDSAILHTDTAEVTQGNIDHDAKNLCSLLHERRETTNTSSRPIITIAHSLGGLVTAQAVVLGDRAAEGDGLREIVDRMKGMIFLSTPFGGSSSAGWGDLIRRVFDFVRMDTDKKTLKTLKPDSQELTGLRSSFPEVIRKRVDGPSKIGVVFFFEKKKTYKIQVVEEKDASYPGVGEIVPMVNDDHSSICKFSKRSDSYKLVKSAISKLMKGTTTIQERSVAPSYAFHNQDSTIMNQVHGTQKIKSQTMNVERRRRESSPEFSSKSSSE